MSKNAFTVVLVQGDSAAPQVKKPFIAENDEVEEIGYTEGDESGEEDNDLFDSVCSICDNGGELLWYTILPPKGKKHQKDYTIYQRIIQKMKNLKSDFKNSHNSQVKENGN